MYRDAVRAEGHRSMRDPGQGLRSFVEAEVGPEQPESETPADELVPFDPAEVRRELHRLAATSPGPIGELYASLEKIVGIIEQLIEVMGEDEQVMAGLSDIFAHIHLEVQQALLRQAPRSSGG